MSQAKDYFDAAELNCLAYEIISDIASQPLNPESVESDDVFICKLAYEIQQDAATNKHVNTAVSSLYTDTSLYLPSTNNSLTNTTDKNLIYNYNISPMIVSQHQFVPDDSFNESLPSIPSKSPQPIPYINNYNISNSRFSSPFHPPPESKLKISLCSTKTPTVKKNVEQCLSPRHRTPKSRACAVPDFAEFNGINSAHYVDKKEKNKNEVNADKNKKKEAIHKKSSSTNLLRYRRREKEQPNK